MFHSTGKKATFKNDTGFIVNFNHLINAHGLTGNFVIEHWNKPDKLWGYYESATDKYYLVQPTQLIQPFYKPGIRINISYNDAIKPTDAILFNDTVIITTNGKLVLTSC